MVTVANRITPVESSSINWGRATVAVAIPTIGLIGSRPVAAGLGLHLKNFGQTAVDSNFNVLGKILNYVADNLIFFGEFSFIGKLSAPEPEGNPLGLTSSGLEKKTVALLIAAPAVGVIGSRVGAGVLGWGVKGMSRAANYVGQNNAGQNLKHIADSLMVFSTRKVNTDLKAGAALTVAAAVAAFIADKLLARTGI